MTDAEVSLRPVKDDTLPILIDCLSDPERVGPYNWVGHPSTVRLRERYKQDGYLGPDDGKLMVCAGEEDVIGFVSWQARHYGPLRCWNIGIALLPEWRGRGYGTRAQRLLVDYLFATTTVMRIEADTEVTNIAEQRALEKAGFTREGVLRSTCFRDGAWRDLVFYSRLRTD